jgi:tetratricopeptide (TPR) repeat protein
MPPSQQALSFKERDWIVVADFENLTGDRVFDRSLRAAAEVGIAQSQFVNVLSAGRVQETLRRMPQAQADRLDEGLASEVAVREGVKAVVAGTIAQIGDVYSITLRLIDPQSHATVMTDSIQAKGKDQVLPALDTLTTRARRSLGESLAAVSQQRTPLPKATTSSLEALKMYADSFGVKRRDSEIGNEDLLRQALALDPEFALAHAEYGWRFSIASDPASRVEGEQHLVKALSLLDRLSARERLWISALVEDSRGNRRQAVEGYKSYLAQYPDDARAWFRMGWTQMAALGEPAAAIDAFKRSLALNPSDASARVNLATCYNGLRRYAEAITEYESAFAVDPALLTGEFVNSEYGFALVRTGQADKAGEVFEKMIAAGRKARGLRSLALLDMYRGQYDAAIVRLREAILVNRSTGAVVSEFRDRLFLVRALDAKGATRASAAELDAVDALAAKTPLGPEWLAMPAKIRARGGQLADARTLLAMMSRTASDATVGSSANRNTSRDAGHLDVARGELALAEGRSAEAVGRFEAARVVDARDTSALESLAVALVASGRLADAAKRYEELIALRPLGVEAQEDWVRAHVRLGEVYERLGKPDSARASYEQLIALWKDGDADLLALKEARDRRARLK